MDSMYQSISNIMKLSTQREVYKEDNSYSTFQNNVKAKLHNLTSNTSYNQEIINFLGEKIIEGKLVAFPTETVYGLGANSFDKNAVLSIFTTKQRPLSDPVISHVISSKQALDQVLDLNKNEELIFNILTNSFWPGPLSIIGKARAEIPLEATAFTGQVAVRCPNHEIAHNLIKAAGVPISAPSANKFGHISPSTALHVFNEFSNCEIDIIDGGSCDIGLESTVIKLEIREIKENFEENGSFLQSNRDFNKQEDDKLSVPFSVVDICILRLGKITKKMIEESLFQKIPLHSTFPVDDSLTDSLFLSSKTSKSIVSTSSEDKYNEINCLSKNSGENDGFSPFIPKYLRIGKVYLNKHFNEYSDAYNNALKGFVSNNKQSYPIEEPIKYKTSQETLKTLEIYKKTDDKSEDDINTNSFINISNNFVVNDNNTEKSEDINLISDNNTQYISPGMMLSHYAPNLPTFFVIPPFDIKSVNETYFEENNESNSEQNCDNKDSQESTIKKDNLNVKSEPSFSQNNKILFFPPTLNKNSKVSSKIQSADLNTSYHNGSDTNILSNNESFIETEVNGNISKSNIENVRFFNNECILIDIGRSFFEYQHYFLKYFELTTILNKNGFELAGKQLFDILHKAEEAAIALSAKAILISHFNLNKHNQGYSWAVFDRLYRSASGKYLLSQILN